MEDSWKRISDLLDSMWPYKRVIAPAHLIERYNETIGKETGMNMTQFAVTVDKNLDVTDEEIWKAMTTKYDVEPLNFGDSKWVHNPPKTGRKKTTLK